MILVFIILGIIIFITLTMFLFYLSNIKLEIKELHISNIETSGITLLVTWTCLTMKYLIMN